MQRTWHMLQALLIGVLVVAPASSQDSKTSDDKPDKTPATLKQVEELKDLLRNLNLSVGTIKQSVDTLTERLNTIDQDVKTLRGKGTTNDVLIAKYQDDLAELQRQTARLRQDLDGINRRLGPASYISGYSGAVPAPPATPGRIRLVNTFYQSVTAVVNGVAYEVMPGQDRVTNPITPGPFYYEVLGIQQRRDLTLNPGETFTVTVYPR
jgi:hypothetical protein